MPIQDLTPQLRTRLSRIERTVGWFITIATLLLFTAFAYYVYDTAERKGWFKTKVEYSTGINNVTGLKVGDSVQLMGFPAGQILSIIPNEPNDYYGVTVTFHINEPYFGYILLDSKVRVVSDFLGNHYLEIIKGYDGADTVTTNSAGELIILKYKPVYDQLQVLEKGGTNWENAVAALTAVIKTSVQSGQYDTYYQRINKTNEYWIYPLESVAIGDRLDAVLSKVELALPNILSLTNQIAGTLTNASGATVQLQATLAEARITLTNISVITSNLRDPHGSLGNWLIPTNLNAQLEQTMASANETLQSAHTTLDHTDTNMTVLVTSLQMSLDNLANLTSNLNSQVQMNTNMLSEVSTAIVHTDDLIQGLKRHWLLRSAFKTNKPPVKVKRK